MRDLKFLKHFCSVTELTQVFETLSTVEDFGAVVVFSCGRWRLNFLKTMTSQYLFFLAPHTNVLLPPCLFIRLIANYYVVLIFISVKMFKLVISGYDFISRASIRVSRRSWSQKSSSSVRPVRESTWGDISLPTKKEKWFQKEKSENFKWCRPIHTKNFFQTKPCEQAKRFETVKHNYFAR